MDLKLKQILFIYRLVLEFLIIVKALGHSCGLGCGNCAQVIDNG